MHIALTVLEKLIEIVRFTLYRIREEKLKVPKKEEI